jgi:hypothetical protein
MEGLNQVIVTFSQAKLLTKTSIVSDIERLYDAFNAWKLKRVPFLRKVRIKLV